MKLKPSEAAFILICLAAAAVSVAAVYISRARTKESPLYVEHGTEYDAYSEYDVSVLNSATAADFMQISGIGEVKAGDIIAYRDAIGGFKSAAQLKDVSGISDSLFQRIIDYFYLTAHAETSAAATSEAQVTSPEPETTAPEKTADEPRKTVKTTASTEPDEPEIPPETVTEERVMREVNVNEASAEEIADALLIEPELAEEIVALRERIHKISTVQELYGFCEGMTAEIYRRIKDYVRFD